MRLQIVATGALLIMLPALLAAQADPDEYFDPSRFSTLGADIFETFVVEETQPLRRALDAGLVGEDTAVLVTETAAGKLALLTDQMWFHHIAQGEAAGEPWMVSF